MASANYSLSFSIAEATFGDGVTKELDTWSVQSSTPIGNQLFLSSSDDNSRVVRLVLITPEQDWRQDQNYLWKLDNAWMSDSQHGWLHWNVEGFIDSQIQVSSLSLSLSSSKEGHHRVLFVCDRMEFHFRKIEMKLTTAPDPTKLILRNITIGAFIPPSNYSSSSSSNERRIYHPCPTPSLACEIVDGIVSTSPISKGSSGLISSVNNNTLSIIGGSILFVVIILSFCCWCRNPESSKQYEQIHRTEDHEKEEPTGKEATYQNFEHHSKKGISGSD
jgi:hypothetical protein